MALTQFEKDLLKEVHTELVQPGKKLSGQEKADLETIIHGEEIERKALLETWIADVFIDRCTDLITEIDATKVNIQQRLADLQGYVP